MAIIDLFSKRKAKERGDISDVYTYDVIPQSLRVQIIHIWNETLGNSHEYWKPNKEVIEMYKFINKALCREYGKFALTKKYNRMDINYYEDLTAFLLEEQNSERVIDVIELTFRAIDKLTRDYDYRPHEGNPNERADNAIEELNFRFREHSVGYQYENGQIMRVDSEYLHSQTVKPVLVLLSSDEYKGANDEFLSAHEHYRKGEYKECLNYCLKSFESMMKSICEKLEWKYDKNDTSKTLLEICFKNNLIPSFWQNHFTALRSTLESGIPTGRNKLSGHGQGSDVIEIPSYIASFLLHSTAASLIFLGEASKKIKNV